MRRRDVQDATGNLEFIPGRGVTRAWGPGRRTDGVGTPTNGAAGYAVGCLWHDLINATVYVNTGTLTSATWTLLNLATGSFVAGVASGYKLARGVTALDGSNPTPVTTGLTTVVAATVSLEGTSAPGVGTSVLTVDSTNYATGALSIYAWKPTSSSNPTLIASTGTENFEWLCVGT